MAYHDIYILRHLSTFIRKVLEQMVMINRDPQLAKVKRIRDCRIFSPTRNIFTILSASKPQESLQKRRYIQKVESEVIAIYKKTVLFWTQHADAHISYTGCDRMHRHISQPKPDKILLWKGELDIKLHTPTKELLAILNCRRKKDKFLVGCIAPHKSTTL